MVTPRDSRSGSASLNSSTMNSDDLLRGFCLDDSRDRAPRPQCGPGLDR